MSINDRLINLIRENKLEQCEKKLEKHSFNQEELGRSLIEAAKLGHNKICILLIKKGADIDYNSRYVVDNAEILNYKVDKRKLHFIVINPLTIALSEGKTDTAKLLIEQGADISPPLSKVLQPIEISLINNFNEIYEILEKKGAKCRDDFLLMHYSEHNNLTICEKIIGKINHDKDLDKLIKAAKKQDTIELYRLLMKQKQSVITNKINLTKSKRNQEIDNKLVELISQNNIERCKQLLKNKNICKKEINMALIMAAKYGHTNICELLLTSGANIDFTSRLILDNADMLEYNSTNSSKHFHHVTPLLIAIYNKHTETAKMLINKGANIEHKLYNVLQPIELALKNNLAELYNILDIKGAKCNIEFLLMYHANNNNLTICKGILNESKHEIDIDKLLESATNQGKHGLSSLLKNKNLTPPFTKDSKNKVKFKLKK